VDENMTTQEVLDKKTGACRDYVRMFTEMCQCAGIRAKKLHGFAKGFDYRAGSHFKPGKDMSHAWSAVYISGSWRFVDPTWGAGAYSNYDECFIYVGICQISM
jgi:transglutaminase/protease-like cytokinesis protein 3